MGTTTVHNRFSRALVNGTSAIEKKKPAKTRSGSKSRRVFLCWNCGHDMSLTRVRKGYARKCDACGVLNDRRLRQYKPITPRPWPKPEQVAWKFLWPAAIIPVGTLLTILAGVELFWSMVLTLSIGIGVILVNSHRLASKLTEPRVPEVRRGKIAFRILIAGLVSALVVTTLAEVAIVLTYHVITN